MRLLAIPQYHFRVIAARNGIVATAALGFVLSCETSIENRIEDLGAGPDEREAARHELVLASDEAVGPLISALESLDDRLDRAEVADILVGIMVRSSDERIAGVLEKHLLDDPDSAVRGRIAEELGLYSRSEFFDLFLQAVSDPSPLVQAPALLALANVLGRLSDEQTELLRQLARQRAGAPEQPVRDAALYLVEEFVGRWAQKARAAALKADLAAADSIYNVALAYAPASKQANYYMGTFYLEFGDRARGLQLLREKRLLVDAPRFSNAPQIDGRLDDPVWENAARIDSFYTHAGGLRTTLQPRVQTNAFIGYTDEAMYWGVHLFDAHPESLMVLPYDDLTGGERHDRIMFWFDRNLDRKTISLVTVNGAGVVRDGWNDFNKSQQRDYAWDAEGSAAAYVGDDFWSVEFELRWDPKYHPPPVPGDISGIDIMRVYRAVEYSQTFPGYDFTKATGYVVYQ